MNIRPTTEQVLRDVAEELNREIMPLLSDSTDQIRLHMVMAVLNQCAGRAATEIDLMKREIASYRDYAAAVGVAEPAVTESADLRLESVLAEYQQASELFADALETAMDAGDADLIARGEELLRLRIVNEQAMAGVASVGR